jgi:hypothetical protein
MNVEKQADENMNTKKLKEKQKKRQKRTQMKESQENITHVK